MIMFYRKHYRKLNPKFRNVNQIENFERFNLAPNIARLYNQNPPKCLKWIGSKTFNQAESRTARHANVTNLSNRTLLYKEINSKIENAKLGNKLAILCINIDRLKRINSTLGHSVGDKLLFKISERLYNSSLKEKYFIVRTYEDEFNIIINNISFDKKLISNIEGILQTIRSPFIVDDVELYISASIGVSLYPDNGLDVDILVRSAEIAVNYSKGLGGDCYTFYENNLNRKSLYDLEIAQGLIKAIEKNELSLQYQPKINLINNSLDGMEALLRWKHGKLGYISPVDFIPIAEETGMIVRIGEWVLKEACIQNRKWQDAGYKSMRVAVNLSAKQLQKQDFLQMVKRILNETKLDPKSLELEITESSAINNFETTNILLKKLRRMGIHISMDDFGTGYSSLNYLKDIYIDSIKMDRSFIRDITINPSNMAIACTIINLAHMLNLKVTAEGVETNEQLSFLREHKCDYVQGYIFSKPLSTAEFERKILI